jgi:hypothetical protein
MAAVVETRLVHLKLPHQGGACREACFMDNWHGSALLLLNFSYVEKWRWCCRVIVSLDALHAFCSFFCFCYVLDVILRFLVQM